MEYFITEHGSIYLILEDCRTQRYKVLHEGHNPNDVGNKKPSQMTVYVDFDEGVKLFSDFAWGIRNILITSWALYGTYERDNKLVLSEPIYYDNDPQLGKSPFEFWQILKNKYGTLPTVAHLGNRIILIK